MPSNRLWIPTILAAASMLSPVLSGQSEEPAATGEAENWAAFELSELTAERRASGRAYLRFLRVPSLSTGIYELEAGGTDRQRPHDRDEIYYVAEGQARLEVDGEDVAVRPGSIVYVKAGVEHRFHSIEKALTVLVVFAAGPSDE